MATCADCGEAMFDDEPVHVRHVAEERCAVRQRYVNALRAIATRTYDARACWDIAAAALEPAEGS